MGDSPSIMVTLAISETYIIEWDLNPRSGILPLPIIFSGFLTRSAFGYPETIITDPQDLLKGETVSLQYFDSVSGTWKNTGATAVTGYTMIPPDTETLYTGYFNGSFTLAYPTFSAGAWLFRIRYVGNVSKELLGCDAPEVSEVLEGAPPSASSLLLTGVMSVAGVVAILFALKG